MPVKVSEGPVQYPPLHVNCRSTLVPILKGEKIEDVLNELCRPEVVPKSKEVFDKYGTHTRTGRVRKPSSTDRSPLKRVDCDGEYQTYDQWFKDQPEYYQEAILGKKAFKTYKESGGNLSKALGMTEADDGTWKTVKITEEATADVIPILGGTAVILPTDLTLDSQLLLSESALKTAQNNLRIAKNESKDDSEEDRLEYMAPFQKAVDDVEDSISDIRGQLAFSLDTDPSTVELAEAARSVERELEGLHEYLKGEYKRTEGVAADAGQDWYEDSNSTTLAAKDKAFAEFSEIQDRFYESKAALTSAMKTADTLTLSITKGIGSELSLSDQLDLATRRGDVAVDRLFTATALSERLPDDKDLAASVIIEQEKYDKVMGEIRVLHEKLGTALPPPDIADLLDEDKVRTIFHGGSYTSGDIDPARFGEGEDSTLRPLGIGFYGGESTEHAQRYVDSVTGGAGRVTEFTIDKDAVLIPWGGRSWENLTKEELKKFQQLSEKVQDRFKAEGLVEGAFDRDRYWQDVIASSSTSPSQRDAMRKILVEEGVAGAYQTFDEGVVETVIYDPTVLTAIDITDLPLDTGLVKTALTSDLPSIATIILTNEEYAAEIAAKRKIVDLARKEMKLAEREGSGSAGVKWKRDTKDAYSTAVEKAESVTKEKSVKDIREELLSLEDVYDRRMESVEFREMRYGIHGTDEYKVMLEEAQSELKSVRDEMDRLRSLGSRILETKTEVLPLSTRLAGSKLILEEATAELEMAKGLGTIKDIEVATEEYYVAKATYSDLSSESLGIEDELRREADKARKAAFEKLRAGDIPEAITLSKMELDRWETRLEEIASEPVDDHTAKRIEYVTVLRDEARKKYLDILDLPDSLDFTKLSEEVKDHSLKVVQAEYEKAQHTYTIIKGASPGSFTDKDLFDAAEKRDKARKAYAAVEEAVEASRVDTPEKLRKLIDEARIKVDTSNRLADVTEDDLKFASGDDPDFEKILSARNKAKKEAELAKAELESLSERLSRIDTKETASLVLSDVKLARISDLKSKIVMIEREGTDDEWEFYEKIGPPSEEVTAYRTRALARSTEIRKLKVELLELESTEPATMEALRKAEAKVEETILKIKEIEESIPDYDSIALVRDKEKKAALTRLYDEISEDHKRVDDLETRLKLASFDSARESTESEKIIAKLGAAEHELSTLKIELDEGLDDLDTIDPTLTAHATVKRRVDKMSAEYDSKLKEIEELRKIRAIDELTKIADMGKVDTVSKLKDELETAEDMLGFSKTDLLRMESDIKHLRPGSEEYDSTVEDLVFTRKVYEDDIRKVKELTRRLKEASSTATDEFEELAKLKLKDLDLARGTAATYDKDLKAYREELDDLVGFGKEGAYTEDELLELIDKSEKGLAEATAKIPGLQKEYDVLKEQIPAVISITESLKANVVDAKAKLKDREDKLRISSDKVRDKLSEELAVVGKEIDDLRDADITPPTKLLDKWSDIDDAIDKHDDKFLRDSKKLLPLRDSVKEAEAAHAESLETFYETIHPVVPEVDWHSFHMSQVNTTHRQIQQHVIERSEGKQDLLDAEFDEYIEGLLDEVKGGYLQTRIDDGDLLSVFMEGEFKNQFQTGTSGGTLDETLRSTGELGLFNLPLSTAGKDRPKYGFISNMEGGFIENGSNRLDQYGNTTVTFKDTARHRATWTGNDSLSEGFRLRGDFAVSQLIDPQKYGLYLDAIDAEDVAINNPASSLYENTAYVEAQLHGKWTPEDVASIYFKSAPTGAAEELLVILDEEGIPYKIQEDIDNAVSSAQRLSATREIITLKKEYAEAISSRPSGGYDVSTSDSGFGSVTTDAVLAEMRLKIDKLEEDPTLWTPTDAARAASRRAVEASTKDKISALRSRVEDEGLYGRRADLIEAEIEELEVDIREGRRPRDYEISSVDREISRVSREQDETKKETFLEAIARESLKSEVDRADKKYTEYLGKVMPSPTSREKVALKILKDELDRTKRDLKEGI